jgi:hypothetical protein
MTLLLLQGFLQWLPVCGDTVSVLPSGRADALVRKRDQHRAQAGELGGSGASFQGRFLFTYACRLPMMLVVVKL